MRSSPRGHGVAILLVLACWHLPILLADQPEPQKPANDAAAQLVRQALEAEAQGDASRRSVLLQQALAEHPDCAAAHWQLGEVRVGDRWLSTGEAVRREVESGHVAEYRQQRDKLRPVASDHVKLARWCEKNGLPAEERLHLLWALLLAPRMSVVIDKLGLTRYHGQLMTPQQAEAMAERDKQAAIAVKTWKPKLERLRRDIEGGTVYRQVEAQRELESIDDPHLIPALEHLTMASAPQIGEAVVASLSKMGGQSATDSLARHAVFVEHPTVRKAAAESLKPRSLYSYVPPMMNALQKPTEVFFEQYYSNGQFTHRLGMFHHGVLADTSYVSSGGTEFVRISGRLRQPRHRLPRSDAPSRRPPDPPGRARQQGPRAGQRTGRRNPADYHRQQPAGRSR